MIYVCPAFPGMTDELADCHRLYAYPRQPSAPAADAFVILDSGAYGLAKGGAKMNAAYVEKLAAHYQQHHAENVLCIAPDEYLNPRVTMNRFSDWHSHHSIPVVPVIQFPREKHLDLFSAYRQAQFYAAQREALPRYQGRPFLAVSNPNLRASQCYSLKALCLRIRALFGPCWLHCLGAGWWPQDIVDWRNLGCFDSIDSIAYYTDAQQHQRWQGQYVVSDFDTPFPALAAHNAHVARQIAAASPTPKN